MHIEKLRKLAAEFLRGHNHPRYAERIKTLCAVDVVGPLLRSYGKGELLWLYGQMSKELQWGFLYWFPPFAEQLRNKLKDIDSAYHSFRADWSEVPGLCSHPELENYFRELEDAILPWLRGEK